MVGGSGIELPQSRPFLFHSQLVEPVDWSSWRGFVYDILWQLTQKARPFTKSKEHSEFIKRSSCLGVCRHNCWWKLNVDGCCGRRTILWLGWIALLGGHQLRLGHRPDNAEGDDLRNDGAIPELGHRGWWRGRCRRSSPLSAFCSGWFLGGAGADSEGEKSWSCGFSCAGRAR